MRVGARAGQVLVGLVVLFVLAGGCSNAGEGPAVRGRDGIDSADASLGAGGKGSIDASAARDDGLRALGVETATETPAALATAVRLASNEPRLAAMLASNPSAWLGEEGWVTSPGWRSAASKRFDDLGARVPASAAAPFEVGLSQFTRFRLAFTPERAAEAHAVHHDGRLVYPNAFPSTDQIVATTLDRFEVLLLMREAAAPHDFSWRVDVPRGLTVRAEANRVEFDDRKGRPVLRIPRPFAVDAAGHHKDADLTWKDGRLAMHVDTSGLDFPVLLDPSIEQTVWTALSGFLPGPREFSAMAFDPVGNRAVLYGGAPNGGNAYDNSVWDFDGTSWTLENSPCPFSGGRAYHKMVWDTFRHKAVMFGGIQASTGTIMGDTWLYDPTQPLSGTVPNTRWDPACGVPGACGFTGPAPACNVTARWSPQMAFDSYRNVVVLYGGGSNGADDMYDFNGTSWTVRCNPCGLVPAGQMMYEGQMVFDSSRNRLVLYGGRTNLTIGLADTWELPDTSTTTVGTWTKVQASSPPGKRMDAVMVYDPARQKTILYGGWDGSSTYYDDTWEWDGATWIRMTTTSTGSPRRGAAGTFFNDPNAPPARRLLLHGGSNTNTPWGGQWWLGDAWEYYTRGGGGPTRNAGSCSTNADCDTDFCVDGVCCESSSCPLCQNCNLSGPNATTGITAAPGTCAAIPLGSGTTQDTTAPACTTGATCGAAAGVACACNGTGTGGACLIATGQACSASSTCASGACVDGFCCNTNCNGGCQVCAQSKGATGNGACTTAPAGYLGNPGCNGAICSGSSPNCPASCSTDANCAADHYCSGGSCLPKAGNGSACTCAPGACNQCTSGNCYDGVCCDSACGGTCSACTAAKKGAGVSGACGPISAGLVPNPANGTCATQAASTCGTNGKCDGAGACQRYAGGTACGASSCNGNVPQSLQCNGAGACIAVSGGSCGNYACVGGACKSSCATQADCAPGSFCNAGTCQLQAANGSACTAALCSGGVCPQCTSGNCVDGVCCDQPCTGFCQACSATKKGTGANGVCGNINPGADPDGECPADPQATCGRAGGCNGAGACRLWGLGTSCSSTTTCVGNVATGSTCNGLGACQLGGADSGTTDCTPYVCQGSGCVNPCQVDAHCVAGNFCSQGVCKAKQANGATCTDANQCLSNFCVDGVCCNTLCNGTCQACSAATTVSGQSGTCDSAKAGLDPHNSCPDDGATSCQRNGLCDGTGACQLYAQGTACGSTSCASDSEQDGHACNGTGTCQPNAQTFCKEYKCKASACLTSCTTSDDCAANYFCDATNKCVARSENGTACTDAKTCKSGLCVDGVCCNDACSGQCQACDVPNALGVCSNVVGGQPHGSRAKCPDANPNEPCSARLCDGTKSPSTCAGFVGSDVGCRDQSCTNGVEAFSATCNGAGQCGTDVGEAGTQSKACYPFACGDNACKTTCSADTDCAPGSLCDKASGQCTNGSTCDTADDHTEVSGTGRVRDCTPYKCNPGQGKCFTTCATVNDCAGDNVCQSDGTCAPAVQPPAPTAACACRSVGASTSSAPGGLNAGVVVAGLILVVRRRRRGQRAA